MASPSPADPFAAEVIVNLIADTTTSTGLKIQAELDTNGKGVSYAFARLIKAVLQSRDDWSGHFSVVEEHRLRMQPLPEG